MPNKTLYLAYGSNINLEQMAFRCPTSDRITTGYIQDYELEFRGVATIVPKENSSVPVLIWELEPADERSLDRYEGFPSLYRKEAFDVVINGETRTAMAYVMNRGSISLPSPAYYGSIMKGYLANGMDPKPLEEAYHRAEEAEEEVQEMYQTYFDLKGGW